jgi:hypothetical protein
MRYLKIVQIIETLSTMVISREWEERIILLLNGQSVSVVQDVKCSKSMDGTDGYTTISM